MKLVWNDKAPDKEKVLISLEFDSVRLKKCSILEHSIVFELAKCLGGFDYVLLLNPIQINRMTEVRLSLITECSIGYAGKYCKCLFERIFTEAFVKFLSFIIQSKNGASTRKASLVPSPS